MSINDEILGEAIDCYANSDLSTIDEGAQAAFHVEFDGETFDQALVLPNPVNVTSPVSGSSLNSEDPIILIWDTDPTHYEFLPEAVRIVIFWVFTANDEEYSVTVPFSEGTYTIPAGTIDYSWAKILVDALDLSQPTNSRLLSGSEFRLGNRREISLDFE